MMIAAVCLTVLSIWNLAASGPSVGGLLLVASGPVLLVSGIRRIHGGRIVLRMLPILLALGLALGALSLSQPQPERAVVRLAAISAQIDAGELESAWKTLDRWAASEPGNQDVRRMMGRLLMKQGKYDEMMTWYQPGLDSQPPHADSCMDLVAWHLERKEAAAATDILNRMLPWYSDRAAVHEAMGDAAVFDPLDRSACGWYRTAAMLPDATGASQAKYAWQLALEGETVAAIRWLDQADATAAASGERGGPIMACRQCVDRLLEDQSGRGGTP